MAIQRAFSSVTLPGNVGVRQPDRAAIMAPSRALAQLGASIGLAGRENQRLKKIKDRDRQVALDKQTRLDDANIITEAVGAYARKLGEESAQRQTTSDLTAPDYTKEFDKFAVSAQVGLPGIENLSQAGQSHFAGLVETIRNGHYKSNLNIQGDATKSRRGELIDGTRAQSSAAVFENPALLELVLKGWGEQMDLYRETPAFSVEDFRERVLDGRADILKSAVLGRIQKRGYDEAREILEQQKYVKEFDAGTRVSLASKITAAEQRELRTNAAERAGLLSEANSEARDLMRQIDQGIKVDAEQLVALSETIKAAGGAESLTHQNLQAAIEGAAAFDIMRSMSPAELSNSIMMMEGAIAENGGRATRAEQWTIESARRLYGVMSELKNTDPVGLFNRLGLGQAGPIAFTGEGAEASMQERSLVAKQAGSHLGVPPIYLRPEEKENLEKHLAEATGDEMLAITGAIYAGFGGSAEQVFGEISDHSQTFAYVAGLFSLSEAHGRSASIAFAGQARANKGQKLQFAEEGDRIGKNAITREALGGALRLLPGVREGLEATAEVVMLELAWREDEQAGQYDPKLWETSLAIAAGAVTIKGRKIGGVGERNSAKFILPAGMTNDQADDVLDWLNDDYLIKVNGGKLPHDSASGAVNAERIKEDGRLVTFDMGRYFIDLGDDVFGQYVASDQGPDGRFLLDLGVLDAERGITLEREIRAEEEARTSAAGIPKERQELVELRAQLAAVEGQRDIFLENGAPADNDLLVESNTRIGELTARIRKLVTGGAE